MAKAGYGVQYMHEFCVSLFYKELLAQYKKSIVKKKSSVTFTFQMKTKTVYPSPQW